MIWPYLAVVAAILVVVWAMFGLAGVTDHHKFGADVLRAVSPDQAPAHPGEEAVGGGRTVHPGQEAVGRGPRPYDWAKDEDAA